jgi:AraC-like DNA-binding protein
MWWHQQSLTHFSSHRYMQSQYVENDYRNLPRQRHTFGYIERGEIVFESESVKFTARENDIVFVPQGLRYRSVWSPNSACLSCHFQFPQYEEPFGNKVYPLQKFRDQADKKEHFSFLVAHEEDRHALFASLSHFFSLCDLLFPLLQYRTASKVSERIRRSVTYIEENFTQPITVEELAALSCMSTSHFFACFKEELGISPIAYKNKLLCDRAAQLLTDDRAASIEEISDRLGFSSCAYFRRLFRDYCGTSPRDYRKQKTDTI